MFYGAQAVQEPDNKPGNYYVSATDNGQFWLLLGPFPNDHAAALARVEEVRKFANEKNPRSFWFAFGTVRMPEDHVKPGNANKYLMPEAA